jgi:hypothetical protein
MIQGEANSQPAKLRLTFRAVNLRRGAGWGKGEIAVAKVSSFKTPPAKAMVESRQASCCNQRLKSKNYNLKVNVSCVVVGACGENEGDPGSP